MDARQAIRGRRVFVTGGNGFIGRRLVGALDDAGAKVTLLCRTRPAGSVTRSGSVETIVGDLTNTALLEAGLQGREIVFHLAYDGRATATANLAAFDAVLAASEKAGVGRIVHASSIVVYDDWPNGDIDETASMGRPGGSGYRQAKIEMERRLMAGRLPAAILQPTLVYGPGSAFWTEQFVEWLRVGDVVLPTPEGHCHGLFVDDLVQALLRAATLPDLARERFIVSGAEPFAWSGLLEGYARIAGRGGVRHVPMDDLRARVGPEPDDDHHDEAPSRLAAIHVAGRRLLGRDRFERLLRLIKGRLAKGVVYPDQHLLGVFSATGQCSIRRARERLGFEPEFDLAKGLAAIASARGLSGG
jgi:nucleoside-diphosphate-sugar epimerase